MVASNVKAFEIKVPATSANIGPGYDVMGLSLSLFLLIKATVDPSAEQTHPTNIAISYDDINSSGVSLDPTKNLITKTALYVLSCNGLKGLPSPTHLHISNNIPLGRGLGSSGAAVVAGVVLANVLAGLGLSVQRQLDYCLMIEHHPDNVAAALVGGFVASYLTDVDRPLSIPASESGKPQEKSAGDADSVQQPPVGIGHYLKLGCSKKIKAVALIPHFELATSKARGVLPPSYTTKDVVFNLQRLAVLTTALGQETPDPWLIYHAMEDKIHQPYRQNLVPGLPEILESMDPSNTPGLLGICLSGAGPTILALASDNFDAIGNRMKELVEKQKEGLTASFKVLDIIQDGVQCKSIDSVSLNSSL
ncbi:hypothetical protein H4219_003565 [Mycoemilia scoparia]|uniref:Homoserine kinase n=1 Tax=Mycoemilia scoparia TaxID=417184 RepID=A0A9W7ZUF8_9FUNG|nr:hypothetical protein H4219_003565 [Mycoemilia scoparia]